MLLRTASPATPLFRYSCNMPRVFFNLKLSTLRTIMIKQSRKPTSRDSHRCHHRFANATRCRMPALAAGGKYCPRHFDLIENESGADAAEELMDDLQMNSADDVRVVLSRLINLVAENRITPRRAYIITRIC